ncbi:MAG: hypothetical protein ACXVCY_16825 [Pseudobdellovibrionaceae bacterium]
MKKACIFQLKLGALKKNLTASHFETRLFRPSFIFVSLLFTSVLINSTTTLAKVIGQQQQLSIDNSKTKKLSTENNVDSTLRELIQNARENQQYNNIHLHNYKLLNSIHQAEIIEAQNGGWGGGTGVLRSSQNPLFYDLYLVKNDMADPISIEPNLPLSLFFKRVHFDHIKIENLPEYKHLISLLDSWKSTVPGLIREVKKALSELNLSYTDIPLKRFDRVKTLPNNISPEDLVPLITYNRILGARIYRPIWMLLGDRSRLAALIHEAFRVIELKWSYGLSDPEFDTKIQKLTAILVLADPHQYKNEAQVYSYLTPLLKEEIENTDTLSEDPSLQIRNSIKEKLIKDGHELKELYGNTHTEVSNWMTEMEGYLKKYLQANEDYKYSIFTPWKESDRNFFEALADGISFYNTYLQERWNPYMDGAVLVDLKNLIHLAEKRPDLKIFENPKIYNCLMINDWFSDVKIKKDENTLSTQLQKSSAQSIENREQCIQKLIEE